MKHLILIQFSLIPTPSWKPLHSFFVDFDNLILRSRVFDFIIHHKYRTLSDLVATDFFEHIWHVSWQCYIAKEKRRIIMMDGEGRTKGSFYFFLSFLTIDAPWLKPRTYVVFRRAIVQQMKFWPSTDCWFVLGFHTRSDTLPKIVFAEVSEVTSPVKRSLGPRPESVWRSLNIWSASLILPLCHQGTQQRWMVRRCEKLPQTISFPITMTSKLRYVRVIRRWGPWQIGWIFRCELAWIHYCCYGLG